MRAINRLSGGDQLQTDDYLATGEFDIDSRLTKKSLAKMFIHGANSLLIVDHLQFEDISWKTRWFKEVAEKWQALHNSPCRQKHSGLGAVFETQPAV